MIKNYLLIAVRNLFRYRLYTLLNVSGLAIGLATSILILLWVLDEISYDRFHPSTQQLYRVTADVSGVNVALTPAPMAESLRNNISSISDVAQIATSTRLVTVGDVSFEEMGVLFVDSSFFSMFAFSLLNGDVPDFATNNTLLLTESMAQKYFGRTDVVGRLIQIDRQNEFIIGGILKDVPSNSHLQFDFLLPMSFYRNTDEYKQSNCWDCYYGIYTYVELVPDKGKQARVSETAKNINRIYTEQKNPMKATFSLQPLADIHLKSLGLVADLAVKGNDAYVKIFSLVALFVLIVASVNFMNLATSQSATRAKEAGMRKVMGANIRQLIGQFLGESFMITLISLCVSLLFVLLALPSFNEITGKNLRLIAEPNFIMGLIVTFLLTGLLSGSYPALYFSNVNSLTSLKGTIKAGRKSVMFRNTLVILQFVVTIVLLACTTVVYQQLQYLNQRDIGYKKENLMYALMNRDMSSQYSALRSELEKSDVLQDYTVVSDLPANMNSGTYAVEWDGKSETEQIVFALLAIDEHFVKTLGITLLNGRSFSNNFYADSANVVVNEKALDVMGLDSSEAIGKKITVNGITGTIIGVAKDFHFKPLQDFIQPLIMTFNTVGGFVIVRTPSGAVESHVAGLKQIFNRLAPAYPFTYGFLDRDFQELYRTEHQAGILTSIFAVLAIFIACLGLFGLSAFTAEQRTREIGVRKLVGATVGNIVLLLSRDLFRLLFIALMVAIPVAWYLAHQWLESYAYHVPLNPSVFIGAGALALLVALVTTCFQSIKAGLSNPANALKHQ